MQFTDLTFAIGIHFARLTFSQSTSIMRIPTMPLLAVEQ